MSPATQETLSSTVKRFVKRPGTFFFETPSARAAYAGAVKPLLWYKRQKRAELARQLPKVAPDRRVSRDQGYRVMPAQPRLTHLDALLAKADEFRAREHGRTEKGTKAHLEQLVSDMDVARSREILDFALDPEVLAVANDYLGELPVLTNVLLWHSRPTDGQWDNSQLFHLDHDDTTQMKIFVFCSDVRAEHGPLTVVPRYKSRVVAERIGYTWAEGRGKVTDEEVRAHLAEGDERPLTGPRGTVAFADTSGCFHYGSRVQKEDRHVFMFQYMTLSNFLFNPVTTRVYPYPYAKLAAREGFSAVQRAALTGNA